MPFEKLGLSPALCRSLVTLGYTEPTPIQSRAIPVVLDGRDLFARAQTGTGKTAAFALPMLERLLLREGRKPASARRPQALVLAPTRELASQVHDALRAYGRHTPLRSTAIFGGVPIASQIRALAGRVNVVVATPGRLIDHMQQRTVDLSAIEMLTLDEADRMLDMGFLPALRRILGALPRQRQTLLFSATLAAEVKSLATNFTNDAVEVEVARANSVAATVVHRVHRVAQERKRELLQRLLASEGYRQALIFCRTKHGSNRLCRQLDEAGFRAVVIHGNKSQSARTRALLDFKSGRATVLVATDIAARGLDIEHLPVVINYDLPTVAHDYIHRIGRTGRAGAQGHAVSLVCQAEQALLRDIQHLVGHEIEVVSVPGFEGPEPVRTGQPQPRSAPRARAYINPRHPRAHHPRRSGARGFAGWSAG